MNQILNNSLEKTNDKNVLKKISLFLVLCIIICISTIFALRNAENENILNNVYISGIDVSNKSKVEAKSLVEEYVKTFENNSVSLNIDENSYKVTAKELGFSVENLESTIDEAYAYGRGKNFFENNFVILLSNFRNKEFNIEYTLNDEEFKTILEKIIAANESLASDDTYEIFENEISIVRGQNGLKIDSDTLKEYILSAIRNKIENVDVPVIDAESTKVDFEKLYNEVYVAARDASYTSGEKFEVIVEETGKAFDLEKAKEEYSKLESGETMKITLEITEPKVKVSDLNSELFKDVLATYSTTYDTSETNRVQNLTTATNRCNGTIVYPGKEFSFHNTIGTRTIANGYASAHSFAGGKVVNSVGGGICQISSMLYNVVLMSDLKVTERTAHGMRVLYAKPSLDATISEGVYDFKFINNRNYPIMIESSIENGTIKMSIKGIKESTDKNIELLSVVKEEIAYTTVEEKDATMYVGTTKVVQEPVNGCVSEAYKIVKDANGNEISRTLISSDKYIATNKIVKVGTKQLPQTTPVSEQQDVSTEQQETITTPQEEVVKEPEEERDLPQGWDSPESPYVN